MRPQVKPPRLRPLYRRFAAALAAASILALVAGIGEIAHRSGRDPRDLVAGDQRLFPLVGAGSPIPFVGEPACHHVRTSPKTPSVTWGKLTPGSTDTAGMISFEHSVLDSDRITLTFGETSFASNWCLVAPMDRERTYVDTVGSLGVIVAAEATATAVTFTCRSAILGERVLCPELAYECHGCWGEP
jgi:hypothetical protein